MPWKLRKLPGKDLFWVVNIDTGKKYSKLPILKSKAEAQLRILQNTMSGGIEQKMYDEHLNKAIRMLMVILMDDDSDDTEKRRKYSSAISGFNTFVLSNLSSTQETQRHFIVGIIKAFLNNFQLLSVDKIPQVFQKTCVSVMNLLFPEEEGGSRYIGGEEPPAPAPTQVPEELPLPTGFTIPLLMKTYSKFKPSQLDKYPTFESYVERVKQSDIGRKISNVIGEKANEEGTALANASQRKYAEYIKANPGAEEFMYHGKIMSKADIAAEKERAFNEWEDREHPMSKKFFRPALKVLTAIADYGVQLVPVPATVKQMYTNFAPPGSIYYKDNKIKAAQKFLGGCRVHQESYFGE
jgi:hypothetical protein